LHRQGPPGGTSLRPVQTFPRRSAPRCPGKPRSAPCYSSHVAAASLPGPRELGLSADIAGSEKFAMPLLSVVVCPPLALLLWLGACAGHTALMVFALNWLYGFHLPRPVLSAARKVNALLILAGPVFFWVALGLHHDWQIELHQSGAAGIL